jgi:hypothetical protein
MPPASRLLLDHRGSRALRSLGSFSLMNSQEAGTYLLDCLPSYFGYLTDPEDFPEVLHVAMGDLRRYYMAEVRGHPDMVGTYWSAVEQLASDNDEAVRNAVLPTRTLRRSACDSPKASGRRANRQ